jgi:hypothetical protein
MELRVTAQALSAVRELLDLTDDEIGTFTQALKDAGDNFNTNDLSIEIYNSTGLPRNIVQGVIQVLAFLYLEREKSGLAVEMFLDQEVAPALTPHLAHPVKGKGQAIDPKRASEVGQRWTKLRQFLLSTLVLDRTVGTPAKAGPVMTDHERIFESARILTDIRPIFRPDLSEKPSSAVIVHMLRLTTRDIFNARQSQYFALDANDVRFMKQLFERAIKKEETLKNLMDSVNITTIDPKGFF